MRLSISMAIVIAWATVAVGQPKEERRFNVRHNPELYPQTSPKETLGALMRTFDKERYDYLAAFLLDPATVREQLDITAADFEKRAREQVEGEELSKKGFDKPTIRERIRDLSKQANFDDLARRIRQKFEADPEAMKNLRKIYREGEFVENGDAATAKHADIKDRTVYFRRVEGRWYIENRTQE